MNSQNANSRGGKAYPVPQRKTRRQTSATHFRVKRLIPPYLLSVIVCALAAAMPLSAQGFTLGSLSFSLSPKVLKDGSITDLSLGYQYAPNVAGNLRFRFSNTAKNEQFDETVPDSLVAVDDQTFALFLTPFEYAFLNSPSVQLKVGGGLYYEYYTLTEKGFFSMPALESLGKERVNSFSNDFTMHSAGPNITLGFSWRSELFSVAVDAGAVPVFYLNARQDMKITPLMDPNGTDYSQETSGSPYFYADFTVTLFKYISLALLYDYSKLDYKVVDFDDEFKWLTPEWETVSQSLKLEVCAFIPLGGSVYTQIGYGRSFDSIQVNSTSLIESGGDYLILAVKTVK
ncbi:MAG: hypothetical protein LBE74_09615 [Treponema sp.]|jgi:hypothetical protein|nr:hypothetical protein [Treponema sp.]